MNTDIVTQLLEQYKYGKLARQFTDKEMWNTPEGNKRFYPYGDLKQEEVEAHLNGEILLVGQVKKALAWDIDDPIEEDVLLETLEKAYQAGYWIYATPSTSGRSYHLYLYLKEHVKEHEIDAAREMAKIIAEEFFPFKVDKYYPTKTILTVPFHSNNTMIDYTGAEVWDLSGKNNLKEISFKTGIRIPTVPKKKKTMPDSPPERKTSGRSYIRSSKTFSERKDIQKVEKVKDGDWAAFYEAMSSATSKDKAIAVYNSHYKAGMRHQMALDSSSLFFRWGMSRQETLDVVGTIAAQHGDKEIADRLRCVEDTYNRIDFGQPVSGFANHHAPRTAFEAKFWGSPACEIPNELKFTIKTERIIAAMFDVLEDRWGRVSKRSLAEMTGISASTVIRHIQLMIAEGMVERKGNNQNPEYRINLTHKYFQKMLAYEENAVGVESKKDKRNIKENKKNKKDKESEYQEQQQDKHPPTKTSFMGHQIIPLFREWIGRLTERLGNAILAVSESERTRLSGYRYRHWLERMGFQRLTRRKPAAA